MSARVKRDTGSARRRATAANTVHRSAGPRHRPRARLRIRRVDPAVVLTAIALTGAACSGDATRPGPGAPALAFTEVSAGFDRTCGVTQSAELYCWGRRFNGDSASRPALAPRRVPLTRAAARVSVGSDHTCALLDDGTPLCWGSGAHGSLGRPEQGISAVPAPGPATAELRRIAAGAGHTCAVTDDGSALCWGRGLNGELGTGRIEQTHLPGPFGRGLFRFADVSTGQHHTCGLEHDGTVLCSGWNVHGQLGVNATVNLGFPQPVVSPLRFTAVSAGRQHTCALATDGAAWCWGRGDLGQLGTGVARGSLVPVRVAGGHAYAAIAAGDEHICAITTAGAPYCWGHNQFGRAGQPAESAVFTTPTAVDGAPTLTRISAGALHTCAIADDGAAWCWGFGGFGQLGHEGTGNRHVPTPVAAPENAGVR